MDNILIKAVVILLITSIYTFILIYLCLPEVDLEEGQSCPRLRIPPTSGIFVNLCINSIKCNFYTSTSNNLYPVSYGRLRLKHPNPVTVIYTIIKKIKNLKRK